MPYKIPFYNPEHSREASKETEKQDYGAVIELLESEQLAELIKEGKLTLAMIKPSVGPDANKFGLEDIAASDEIESRITGLGELAKFSFTFDSDAADVFYEEPAESMIPYPPLVSDSYENRWEEYKALMTSGPVTVILLYGENAIETWRSHLGHWNIVKNHDPDTIRGALGVDNHNNLVHGSDSPESAAREVRIVTEQLKRLSL